MFDGKGQLRGPGKNICTCLRTEARPKFVVLRNGWTPYRGARFCNHLYGMAFSVFGIDFCESLVAWAMQIQIVYVHGTTCLSKKLLTAIACSISNLNIHFPEHWQTHGWTWKLQVWIPCFQVYSVSPSRAICSALMILMFRCTWFKQSCQRPAPELVPHIPRWQQ